MIHPGMIAFLFKKKEAQITGTKSVRGEARSGTKNYSQVQKYFSTISRAAPSWVLENSKGSVFGFHFPFMQNEI